MIEAVVFDLGDTLVRFDNRLPHAAWEQQLGLARGTLWEVVGAAVDWRPVFLGEDEKPAWAAAAQVLGVATDQLAVFRDDFFACERIDDELLAYARSLRPRFRTAILSDAPAGARSRTIAKFGLDDCFDAIVLSGEIKIGKPDPGAFHAVLNALACPRNVLFSSMTAQPMSAALALSACMPCTAPIARTRSEPCAVFSANGELPVIGCRLGS